MPRIKGKKMGERKEKKKGLGKVPLLRFLGLVSFFNFQFSLQIKSCIVMESICNATLCLWKQVKEQG